MFFDTNYVNVGKKLQKAYIDQLSLSWVITVFSLGPRATNPDWPAPGFDNA